MPDFIDQLIEPQRKGMTATMGYNTETGEYTDASVGLGHSPDSPFADEIPQDFLDPSTLNEGETADDQISDAIQELYGSDLEPILGFMSTLYDQEQINAYDTAVENGDWANVLPLLEHVSEQYYAAVQKGMTVEKVEDSDDSPDLEFAMEILQQAESTDGMERDVLMMAAEYHAGRAEFEDTISNLVEKYGQQAVLEVTQKWNL